MSIIPSPKRELRAKPGVEPCFGPCPECGGQDWVAARLDMDRWSIQPRTSELKRKGLIRDDGQRRPNRAGKLAIVWIAA